MRRVLIANRGEIALRVIRACQELGLETVAVYTEPDRASRHVALADHAYNLHADGYLAAAKLLDIAARAGADAVHPGYGFLAENAPFARACAERHVTWIGPNPDAIEKMGSKTGARRVAADAGVPIVPGTVVPCTEAGEVAAFGDAQGWPVAIKAAAGGGGRGFVVVAGPAECEAGLSRARREGEAYFASGECYLEKYLARPRHIEIQVLGDRYGTAIHLGERECSIQRRHQKLVEECPSPVLTPDVREAMGAAAVQLARAVGYDSAGTVEFLYSDGQFYFLEMNTRIQVEHTITELVYRCDLVKEQIRIAAGAPVRKDLVGRNPEGWAIECRINAEDPARGFRPAPGLVTLYRKPGGPGVRVDDAIFTGWRIPEQYDSLLAKVVAWGEDREEAIARMRRALREIVLEGVPTTIPFHLRALETPEFLEGDLSTHFIGEALSEADLAKLAFRPETPKDASLPDSGHSPEPEGPGPFRRFEVEVDDQRYQVRVAEVGAAGGQAARTPAPRKPRAVDSASSPGPSANGDSTVKAPMHATVQRVLVEVGHPVEAGQTLLVLEAMKMETEIPCPHAGTVQELAVSPGQTVEGGMVLAIVKA
jgi:acetyl-CoA/propionyl-CoA carboxylase biotin carboxyl carrier protein